MADMITEAAFVPTPTDWFLTRKCAKLNRELNLDPSFVSDHSFTMHHTAANTSDSFQIVNSVDYTRKGKLRRDFKIAKIKNRRLKTLLVVFETNPEDQAFAT